MPYVKEDGGLYNVGSLSVVTVLMKCMKKYMSSDEE